MDNKKYLSLPIVSNVSTLWVSGCDCLCFNHNVNAAIDYRFNLFGTAHRPCRVGLRKLAILIHGIVPHVVDIERTFSRYHNVNAAIDYT
uniref:AlNc14C50G3954 protein n=1 Tax=Albugo laibachii Nc14 TaxID=890382 RepID=F0WBA6_9STRA|nr:AlNc14C50G3954 [Albugo laibachii Nc14]|eukprot:CCA18430.1 AlNc14C50G3954 [Albugo laibachii Nc14]